MLEYLNFFLLCAIFALIFYLHSRVKRYLPILKMAEELIGNLGYETPQSDTKRHKLLECVLTENISHPAFLLKNTEIFSPSGWFSVKWKLFNGKPKKLNLCN